MPKSPEKYQPSPEEMKKAEEMNAQEKKIALEKKWGTNNLYHIRNLEKLDSLLNDVAEAEEDEDFNDLELDPLSDRRRSAYARYEEAREKLEKDLKGLTNAAQMDKELLAGMEKLHHDFPKYVSLRLKTHETLNGIIASKLEFESESDENKSE